MKIVSEAGAVDNSSAPKVTIGARVWAEVGIHSGRSARLGEAEGGRD